MARVAIVFGALAGVASAKPVLTYFPIAGRGELARLYAVVGGVDIVDSTDTDGYKTKTPIGYLPALAHPEAGLFPKCTFAFGCLQESLAVERYVRALAPKFAGLTEQQRAVDDMFAMIKEDLIHVEPAAVNASSAPAVVTPLYDRYLTVLENDGYMPAAGFVNGLDHPTGADLAVLVMLESGFPFAKALHNAKYDMSRFPKLAALAKRTAEYPAVAAYLETSKTFYAVLDSSEVEAVRV
mmetsp:Transcript_3682/g.10113  ORF Transcript_3682/g.10113 Transcript_3682/m.10113 type:complete len:239 (-) Transcript_3682:264-980(-)